MAFASCIDEDTFMFATIPSASKDQAATMTAIALAESGGSTRVLDDAFDCAELVQWAAGQQGDASGAHVAISLGDGRTIEASAISPSTDHFLL